MPPEPSRAQSFAIPLAIIVGFGLIALAIYFSNGRAPNTALENGIDEVTQDEGDLTKINPVTDKDHIRGNPNAPIVFIEYSDYDCPFCRVFHDTMTTVMKEYGESGKVAWVYRHFPLESLHPSAPRIAEASECAASLGGNDAFWAFTDALNNSRKVTYGADGQVTDVEPTDMARLPEFATAANVDITAFNACLADGRMADEVAEDYANALAIGANGTPHTIVRAGDEQGLISGAQEYAVVKEMIDTLLEGDAPETEN